MERLDVTILGREYSLACTPGERDSVVAAAQHVDRTMQRLRDASKPGTSAERVAIMAALQLAAELLATPVSGSGDSDFALGDYKRKIEDMQRDIDAVLPNVQV
ncbi:cell division protein ZapA [Verticiella sediminum]|uniref:Cell division protein ZapA n=1 Tax=Verticiella sediminum TaxID=1247510 RepID=A0A556AMU6_9BURK|nr:cell division protein ZapA [Verticiella sediminum]TSH94209.1 cell division protein ZapA [Verticiella sediminum]